MLKYSPMNISVYSKNALTFGAGARLPVGENDATSNGIVLAEDLARAGLGRITVSLDTIDPEVLDAISGDQTLFMRRDEVETAWRWTDSIIEAWEETGLPIKHYNSGTMGPHAATALIAVDGRSWYE